MTVNQLFRIIKNIAKEVKTVRSAYDGDVYTIWNTNEIKYASFVVSISSATKNDNLREYNLVLYYGDRLIQSNSNKNSIFDDAFNTLQSVINKINTIDGLEIEDNYIFRPFEQKFADDLAGAYVEIVLQSSDEIGDCEINDIITEEETLIEQLKEAIRNYQEKDAQLYELLKTILHKFLVKL